MADYNLDEAPQHHDLDAEAAVSPVYPQFFAQGQRAAQALEGAARAGGSAVMSTPYLGATLRGAGAGLNALFGALPWLTEKTVGMIPGATEPTTIPEESAPAFIAAGEHMVPAGSTRSLAQAAGDVVRYLQGATGRPFLGAGAPLLKAGAKLAVRHAPGAAVGLQAAAKSRLEALPEGIQYENPMTYPEALAAAGEQPIPLPSLREAADKIVNQLEAGPPGFPSGVSRPARGLQKWLPNKATTENPTPFETSVGEPIMQVKEAAAVPSRSLESTNEALKSVNRLLDYVKGQDRGAARTLSKAIHQDLEAAAAEGIPGAAELRDAVATKWAEYLREELAGAMGPGGGIVGRRAGDAMEWARPQKALDWIERNPEWVRQMERLMPGEVARMKREIQSLLPYTQVALPRQAGVHGGSYPAAVAGAAGSLAGGAPGAAAGVLAHRFLPDIMASRLGQRAALWGFTRTPMSPSAPGQLQPLALPFTLPEGPTP